MYQRHRAVGAYLRKIREERGFKQADVAIALGVTQPMIAKWESGDYRMRVDQFAGLALTLRMTADQVMEAIRVVGGVPTSGGANASKS